MKQPFVQIFAPGKLMLTGEYTVLSGTPALVAAVDRGVFMRCAWERGDAFCYGMDAEAPTASWSASTEKQRGWTRTQGHDAEAALMEAVLKEVLQGDARDHIKRLWGWTWLADTHAMLAAHLPAKPKLGLGSSAAGAAALTWAALVALYGSAVASQDKNKDKILALALEAHRQFQHGKGSGADVAASVMGGVIQFQLDPASLKTLPSVVAVEPNKVLHWRGVWTGQSASTTQFLAAIDALAVARPTTHADCLRALHDAACAAIDALGDPLAFSRAVTLAESALENLGIHAGVPIVTDTHKKLSALAKSHGLTTKPSGAGGGDLSLVFGPDPDALNRFVATLNGEHHLWPVPLSLDLQGVRSIE